MSSSVAGNTLIMCVMRRKRMWGSTASGYLFLIALFDTLTLITGVIPEWMEYADILIFKEVHAATCKLEKFMFYTVADIAIWLLMAFTADRFMAVCFPLLKRKICTMSRSYMSAILIMCVAVVKNIHVFWTRGPEYEEQDGVLTLKKMCGRPTPAYKHFEYMVRPWIVFVMVNMIPLIAIMSFNIAIITKLVMVSKKSTRFELGTAGVKNNVRRTYSQTTAMCISASVLFLICITPSIVILIGRPWWQDDNEAYDVSKAMSNQIVYLNHSLNIVLYCLTGKRFRTELVGMCRRKDGSSAYHAGAYSGYSVRLRNLTTKTRLPTSGSPASSINFDSQGSGGSTRTGKCLPIFSVLTHKNTKTIDTSTT